MKKLQILLISFLAVLFLSGNALALSYSFTDDVDNWYDQSAAVLETYDGVDSIGIPKIWDITIETFVDVDDKEYLDSIVINMDYRRVEDCLFINTGGDVAWNSWDYVVTDGSLDDSGDNLYAVDDNYIYTVNTDPAGRLGHANGIKSDYLNDIGDDALISVVWDTGTEPLWWGVGTLTYDFDIIDLTAAIELTDDWYIGYTPWCANDVALVGVPEPATMLLLGSGLLGLALVGRKKIIKRS